MFILGLIKSTVENLEMLEANYDTTQLILFNFG